MKIQLFLISVFCALNANAQDYFITFTGTGASTNVSTVKVENLTAGTSLIVNGNDILHLKSIVTGVNSIKDDQSSEIKIYPNPMTDNSTLQIYAPVAGNAVISVLDITGKPVARIQSYLENSRQDFNMSGLNTGFYILNVKGKNYLLSEKFLSNGQTGGTIIIEKINVVIQKTEDKAPEKRSKGVQATVDMEYASGDRLKFTGISGNYSTVKIDIPTSDKTIAFNFIACTDADNNNYPVVEIGNQVWMAENLQTTTYNDGDIIGTTHGFFPIQCELEPKYQWPRNLGPGPFVDGSGRLYTWFAATDSRNICPVDWHVPTDGEWKTLEMFLGMTQEQADSIGLRGTNQGSQLKSSTKWYREGRPINPNGTNSSGFTALPNGYCNSHGVIEGVLSSGTWWSSESLNGFYNAWERTMYSSSMKLSRGSLRTFYGFSVRCLLGEAKFLPALTTTAANNIAQNTATSGGSISSDGNAAITARGVCWSLSANPTVEDNKTFDGTGTGTFTSSITGLSAGTAYYVRAYATNSAGTNYGNEIIINTVVTDVDGNVYNRVTIGRQVWLVENLKTTRYRNGDLIGTTTPATLDIRSEDTPTYQWAWNGNESNVITYGRLYTWYAIDDSRSICPDHWHVPTQAEWTTLTDYLGGHSISGGKLKEAGTTHWLSPNTGATNETGFTALPGGYRLSSGGFGGLGSDGAWRSSTLDNTNEDWTIGMGNSYSDAYGASNSKRSGYSVRCIGDITLPSVTTYAVTVTDTPDTGGYISSDGGSPVCLQGVCWSTSPNPTTSDSKTINVPDRGGFISFLTGLTAGTTYYVRAYAINGAGTGYGNQLSFTTVTK